MVFDVPRIIEAVSAIMTLQEADVILTGTPSGVGPVFAGDHIDAGIGLTGGSEDVLTMKFHVNNRKK